MFVVRHFGKELTCVSRETNGPRGCRWEIGRNQSGNPARETLLPSNCVTQTKRVQTWKGRGKNRFRLCSCRRRKKDRATRNLTLDACAIHRHAKLRLIACNRAASCGSILILAIASIRKAHSTATIPAAIVQSNTISVRLGLDLRSGSIALSMT